MILGGSRFPVGHATFSQLSAPSQAAIVSSVGLPGTVLVFANVSAIANCFPPNQTPFTQGTSIAAIGSGFFVNSQGYFVTNGHVIFANDASTPQNDKQDNHDLIVQAAMNAIAAYEAQTGQTLTPGQVNTVIADFLSYCVNSDFSLVTYAILGTSTASGVSVNPLQALVVGSPSPAAQRDLAILKVNLANAPSLRLGDPTAVQTGDSIWALGFPGAVVLNPSLTSSVLIEPSFTDGIVSGSRTSTSSNPLFQISAAISNGNSGGPVLNTKGEVIGVSELASVNPSNGQIAAGFNFAISSAAVMNYLSENGVSNSPGIVDSTYLQGVAYYYAGAYGSAIKKFRDTLNLYSNQWLANDLIVKAQTSLSNGQQGPSSLDLSVSSSQINQGQAISVTGKVSYSGPTLPAPFSSLLKFDWASSSIRLTYSGPGGSTDHTVNFASDGSFTDTFTASQSGRWTVAGSWSGNDDHTSAQAEQKTFDVVAPGIFGSASLPLVVGGSIALVVIVVAVVAALLFARKKSPTPSYTPYPQPATQPQPPPSSPNP
jgi:S1-C subfamily serine protease